MVTVVVSAGASAWMLEDCLASVRAQNYRDVELIVVDNGMTDRLLAVAHRYADGIERSIDDHDGLTMLGRGAVVVHLDADLVLEEAALADVVRELAEAPDLAATTTAELLLSAPAAVRHRLHRSRLRRGNPAPRTSAWAIRRQPIGESGDGGAGENGHLAEPDPGRPAGEPAPSRAVGSRLAGSWAALRAAAGAT
ncbi:MAG: glycosyltransferase family 2 protein, partial [Dactylosporangium sp.]|nr:glycosyltransferase family 2 protein [Dactylosporangium sp.]NNJ63081.1 glycosyltransferase family 2 protein [Dactylosporangium sp.]